MKLRRAGWLLWGLRVELSMLAGAVASVGCAGHDRAPAINLSPNSASGGKGSQETPAGGASAGGQPGSADDAPFSIDVTRCEPAGTPPAGGPFALIKLDRTGDVIGLCQNWVALADQKANAVEFLNVSSGAVQRVELTAAPLALSHDVKRGLLFAQLSGATKLARIDLSTLEVQEFQVPAELRHLAVGPDGVLFTLDKDTLAILSEDDGSLLGSTTDIDLGGRVAVLPDSNEVIVADLGYSPSSLKRFSFDATTYALTLEETLWDAGTNGQDVKISSDGKHLAFPCGGGNGSGYTIFDYSPRDFSAVAGEWPIGAYPREAAFSYDNSLIATADDARLVFYDVAKHAEKHHIDNALQGSNCDYVSISQLRYSYDDHNVMALFSCGFEGDSAVLAVSF